MEQLVVVGNGMAGVACVEQILKYSPPLEITVFGDETHVNYNRIMLSSVLAGEKEADEITLNGWEWYQDNGIQLRLGVRIVDIDMENGLVIGDDGSHTPFDKLLLATGSSPFIPRIEGLDKDGVLTFRNLDDTRALIERAGAGVRVVVIAAGIRPNVELGRKVGVAVNRGIVVNDFMETSDPRVFAVGECVEHNGQVYGLVAPLLEQGKVLAATLTGNRGALFTGWTPAAKLKIMGVEVFSAGEVREKAGVDVVRYEDPSLGIYKKLLIQDYKLTGCILVGDTSDSHRYMEWLRAQTDLRVRRRNLLFPEPIAD